MDLLRRMAQLGNNPKAQIKPLPGTSTVGLALGTAKPVVRGSCEFEDGCSKRDLSIPSIDKCQQEWRPPQMVEPEEEILNIQMHDGDGDNDDDDVDLGELTTDAKLYVIPRKNGVTEFHSLLHMPSKLPKTDHSDYESNCTFNLLMVDVSGSMNKFWDAVVEGWTSHIAPHLVGRTHIYTFGSSVVFRRSGTNLEKKDFDAGGTDLTGALQTIVNEVYLCKEKYVNIFMITDGDHNTTDVEPLSVINQMQNPIGKICSVYILGAGNSFPVQYSINIRSCLHNGSSNVPTLFWAKENKDTIEQMFDIGKEISGGSSVTMRLDVGGSSLPGLGATNTFHLREWVYFPLEPSQLKDLRVSFKGHNGYLSLEPQEASLTDLKEILHQWNSVIIQRNNKKETLPEGIFSLIERILLPQFRIDLSKGPQPISQRLQKKKIKELEMEFRLKLKRVETIITTGKYKNELELADNVLSTTVTKPKYEIKSFQLKGHADKDFESDSQQFLDVLSQYKEQVQKLSVTPDDCCRITMTSTVSDLQDADFPSLLEDNNKFAFLKEFTITGIPVLAPTRDSAQLNPWTYSIQSTLKSPYTIMSQVAMESYAHSQSTEGVDKIVQLKRDEDNTRFNAIIPVFSPSVAKVMKPLVSTRLYTMCVTFAVLKNPHLIDFDIHMASLAATWVHCLFEYPNTPRPEHAQIRMESIDATATLYIDMPRYAKYIRILKENTPQALMSEGTEKVDGKSIKCESLIKPMFFLHLVKDVMDGNSVDMVKVMELILMEYIGRCLSKYKSRGSHNTPYSDFFAESLTDQRRREDLVNEYVTDVLSQISGNERSLLESYFTFEKVSKAAKVMASEKEKELEKLSANIPLKVDIVKVEKLRNVPRAGDVSWQTLRVFAKELGLSQGEIDHLFSKKNIFVYTAHALKCRASRVRLSQPMQGFDESYRFVSEKVQEECTLDLVEDFRTKFVSAMENSWLKAYFDAHSEVVKPLTQKEIISIAQSRGINVTEETFDQVYKKYRPSTGLLSNACQTKACPYFLQPNRSYNQHAVVERKKDSYFVHGMHQAAYHYRSMDIQTATSEFYLGKMTRSQTPIPREISERGKDKFKLLYGIYKEFGQCDTSN